MFWFDYSIIRYLPNPKRGEIVNIGLAIYRPSGIDIRILNNSTKARIIDGSSDLEDFIALEDSLKNITKDIESPEGQLSMLRLLPAGITVSEMNSFSIPDIGKYESKVNRLFNELIKPFAAQSRAYGHSRFQTRLKNTFRKMELLADDISELSKHKVVANYPIDSGSGLTADFLVKNGFYHMSEVIDFNVNDTKAKFRETTMKLMTFMEGKRNLDEHVNCYFVYSASAEKEKDIVSHLNLVEDYSDKLFNFVSKQDEASYFQLMSEVTGMDLPRIH